jgi:hypothetical protein
MDELNPIECMNFMAHQGGLPSIMGSCLLIPYYIVPSVAFTGKFSPNFDLKNMISTLKRFSFKNFPNSPVFEFFLKLTDFVVSSSR